MANAVAIKLPTFWTNQPAVWFIQTEAQFATRNITDDTTKYHYVVAALDQSTAARLLDILAQPPSTDKYSGLKKRLLSTFGFSRRERACRLLNMRGLGDRKPSELMDEMLGLLDGHSACFIFEQLFLDQLPEDIRLQLSTSSFDDPRMLASQADILWQAKTQASTLACEVSKVRPQHKPTADVNKGSRQKPPAESYDGSTGLCFYHSKYGARAHKCHPPCTWAGNAQANRP